MIKFRYIGDGSFLHGIPAKDLSEDEFNSLAQELKETIIASALYVLVEKHVQPKKEKVISKEINDG